MQKSLLIANKFSNSSDSYNKFCALQRLASKLLIDEMKSFINSKHVIADLGSGTSFFAKSIKSRNQFKDLNLEIYEIDLAYKMLNHWKNRPSKVFPIVADIENMPFKSLSLDAIFSSFALHWIDDFKNFFQNIVRFLKDDAKVFICLPTHETLQNMKIDSMMHFNDFPRVNEIIDSANSAGLRCHNSYTIEIDQKFKDILSAIKWFKIIGANHKHKIDYVEKNNYHFKCRPSIFRKKTNKQIEENTKKDTKEHYLINWKITYLILQKNV